MKNVTMLTVTLINKTAKKTPLLMSAMTADSLELGLLEDLVEELTLIT
jgi:hypothetical protein